MGLPGQQDGFGWWRRFLAAGCAALVLALAVFAASPSLHEQLHQDTERAAPDQCAVVLLTTGLAVAAPMHVAPPADTDWIAQPATPVQALHLDPPGYLLQPERGPPQA